MADPTRTWPALDLHLVLSHPASRGHTDHDFALEELEGRLLVALDDLSPLGLENQGARTWRVFWQTAEQRDRARRILCELFAGDSLLVGPTDVDDENWVERTQAELGPVEAGRFTIVPPWAATGGPNEIVIRPSTGFGTGHHPSTRLCLEALQRLDVPGTSALDVGTGSGVLAIAAHRLGANAVLAVDNDPDSIANAAENLALNGLGRAIELREASLESLSVPQAFDIVIGNLTGTLLCRAAARLILLTAGGGHLVLGGILDDESSDIVAAFQPHARAIARTSEGEWVGLILARES